MYKYNPPKTGRQYSVPVGTKIQDKFGNIYTVVQIAKNQNYYYPLLYYFDNKITYVLDIYSGGNYQTFLGNFVYIPGDNNKIGELEEKYKELFV